MDASAASSRIFVRNLPPTLKDADFQRHFATAGPVTDSKLMASRRIGYVGYKTPEIAQHAVKQFNRTFIKMSKIAVELARSVEELRRDKEPRADPAEDTRGELRAEAPAEKKRKREGVEAASQAESAEKKDAKLSEFLQVMQPGAHTKTWGNEDPAAAAAAASSAAEANSELAVVDADEGESEDDYETIPKRRKTAAAMMDDAETPHSKPLPSRGVEPELTIEPTGNASLPTKADKEASAEQSSAAPGASDADWLRSRTTRLLGLADADSSDEASNDGEEAHETKHVKGQPSAQPKSAAQQRAVSDAGSQTDEDMHEPAQTQQKDNEPKASSTARLFVRNLSYEATEEDLWDHFGAFGALEEIHIPRDGRRASSKGFAYVQFKEGEAADRAAADTDGKPFQGRLLHIIPAAAKRENGVDEYALSKLPHKKQQQIRRKTEAATSTFQWNALFMSADSALSSIAEKLGVSKSEILDPTSSGAAVKQAHAETNVLQETKRFFESNGVEIESFRRKGLSDTVILIKNFAFGTSTDELRRLFDAHGSIRRLLMPPAGTMAIVEFEHPAQARKAFGALAYRKIGDSVLFLEKAPKDIFAGKARVTQGDEGGTTDSLISTTDLLDSGTQEAPSSTLFVRNLNFQTTTANLHDLFLPLKGFLTARVKTKPNPKKSGELLSMGYGFVEFRSKEEAQAALNALNGYNLDSHKLQIRSSHKALDAAEERRREDDAKKAAGRHTKIIIKNLPFEATKHDVRELFSPYGKLRSVRVPKKMDSSTRGFAFGDFVTPKEAQNAMNALAGAHLLGRRLNLEFAAADAVNPEEEIEKMSRKVSKQADKVAARELAKSGQRRKFNLNQDEDDLNA